MKPLLYCTLFLLWGLCSAGCARHEADQTLLPATGVLPDGIYVGRHFRASGSWTVDTAEVRLTVSNGQYTCEPLSATAPGAGWYRPIAGPLYTGHDGAGQDTAVFSDRGGTSAARPGPTLAGFAYLTWPTPGTVQIQIINPCPAYGYCENRYVLRREEN